MIICKGHQWLSDKPPSHKCLESHKQILRHFSGIQNCYYCYLSTVSNTFTNNHVFQRYLLLNEFEERTAEYMCCPGVVAVRTERSEFCTKTTEGHYSSRTVQASQVNKQLTIWQKIKKDTNYDLFHGNSPYSKIPTKIEPLRTLQTPNIFENRTERHTL